MELRWLCFAVLSSAFRQAVFATDSCKPAEEGKPHKITCTFNETELGSSPLKWQAVINNVQLDLASCLSGRCSSSTDFEVTVEQDTSTLKILNTSREKPFNVETNFSCVQGTFVCAPLKVYARPQNVSCRVTTVNYTTGYIEIKCTAERAYPGVMFDLTVGSNIGSYRFTTRGIRCLNTKRNETPIYYRSDCTGNIHYNSLRLGKNYVKARLYPDIESGSLYGVYSADIIIFQDAYVEVTTTETHSGSLTLETKVAIGTGVALTVVVCVAIILGIVICIHWRKSKSEKQRAAEILLDEAFQNYARSTECESSFTTPILGYERTIITSSDYEGDDSREHYEEVSNPCKEPTQPKRLGSKKEKIYENLRGSDRAVLIQEINAFLNKYINSRNLEQRRPL